RALPEAFIFNRGRPRQILSPSAPLTLPVRFWASPFLSCAAPSARSRSLSVASPTACLALPAASLARPFVLSLNSPTGRSPCLKRGTCLTTDQRGGAVSVPLERPTKKAKINLGVWSQHVMV